LEKYYFYFFVRSWEAREPEIHAPARCAGWLQAIFLFVGWFALGLLGK
jgi:hypothetical protein